MGVCSSKNKKYDTSPSDQAQQKQQAEQKQASLNEAVVAAANTPAAAATAVEEPVKILETAAAEVPAADEASFEPATPRPMSGVADGLETPAHTYNSAEKPFRSAMRMSDTNKSECSRRSFSGTSNVGFSVSVDAPESEGQKPSFAGANSISLKKILDIFYDKVVAHEQIGHYFTGIDMVKLKRHQLRFMGLAFGGKELVNEEDPDLNLRKIHYHLIRDKGLSLGHWEVFVGLFDETMDQLEKDIPRETRETAMRSIKATKDYFVPIGEETAYTHSNIAAMPVPEEDEELKCPFAGAAAAEEAQQQQ